MSADALALEGATPQEQGRSAVRVETFKYDNHIVRAFAIATAIWGLVGTSAGLLIACQLFWPQLIWIHPSPPLAEFARCIPMR